MMRKILIAAAIVLGIGAQPALAAGDAAAGKAKAAPCAACHGADGNSAAPTFPKLAGQSERYLLKQLHDIKPDAAGKIARPVPVMMGQLDKLSDQDLADLAAFYAAQKQSGGQAKPDLVAKGEQIFRGGIREKGVPACAACHAPDGVGNAPAGFPRLGGQHADYVATQLKGYRAGADGDANGRNNDGDTQPMRSIAARLSDSEINALASYIAGLH
jgi:cytochrome c553